MDKESIHSKDSYTERRKLFKNIWDTAINMADKPEPENVPTTAKPKVIKTLRLGDTDCINIGKNKKQRIKTLRTVCTKLLDICDKQEADEILYDQMSNARHDSDITSIMFTHPRKRKRKPKKKKVQKVCEMQQTNTPDETTSFEVEIEDGPVTHRGTRPFRDMHSPRIERATLIQQYLNERFHLNKPPLEVPSPEPSVQKIDLEDAHRKVVKKTHRTRKTYGTPSLPSRAYSNQARRVPTHKVTKKKQKYNRDIPFDPLE